VHLYLESQADPIHNTWSDNMNIDKSHQTEVLHSVQRLKMLMNMPNIKISSTAKILELQQSRYGLGDRRSIDQAIQFSGIDFKNLKILGNYCGNLDYVTYIEHPWGADYIPKYDNATEKFIDVRDPGSIYYNASTMASTWKVAHNKWLLSHRNNVGLMTSQDHLNSNHRQNDQFITTSSSSKVNKKDNLNKASNQQYYNPAKILDNIIISSLNISSSNNNSTSNDPNNHDHQRSVRIIANDHSIWIIEHKLLINLIVLAGISLVIVIRIGFYYQSVYSHRDSKHRSIINEVDNNNYDNNNILKAA